MAGAAGSGKTFVGVHLILEKLRANPDANMLFAAQTHGLVLFVAKWLAQRAACTVERDSILTRVHFMYALAEGKQIEGPFEIELDTVAKEGRLKLVPATTKPEYALVVVDEAHHVTVVPGNKQIIQEHAATGKTELLYLSDLSQCGKAGQCDLPDPDVKLTQVVRSTQRIVAAAMQFQATEDAELTRSYCDQPGPPLKPFFFKAKCACIAPDTCNVCIKDFASNTVLALEDQVEMVPTLNLHDRVAILVPDEDFRDTLLAEIRQNVADSEKLLKQFDLSLYGRLSFP